MSVETPSPYLEFEQEINSMVRSGRMQDAMARLNEAVTREPRAFALRMLRSQVFARVGLYSQAIDDVKVARALLPPGDVEQLLRVQELDRILRERSKGTFVFKGALPGRPGWLKGTSQRETDLPARTQ